MRTAIALAALLLADACTAANGGKPLEMRTISSGGNAAAQPERPQSVAAHDAETYARLWSTMVGEDPRPEVDFTKEAVVFLFAGSRSTGGWSVEPKSVAMEGDTLVVDAAIKGPGRGDIVTQAFTSPYAVIAVTPRDLKDVRWQP